MDLYGMDILFVIIFIQKISLYIYLIYSLCGVIEGCSTWLFLHAGGLRKHYGAHTLCKKTRRRNKS